MNSLPKTVTRKRRDCDLNPVPSAPESSTLTTQLPSHPFLHKHMHAITQTNRFNNYFTAKIFYQYMWHCLCSMQIRDYEAVRCPSVCPSMGPQQQTRRRYQSTAAAVANVGSATFCQVVSIHR